MELSTIFARLGFGFVITLKLFGLTLIFALPLGLIISFGLRSKFKPISWFCNTFVWIIRGSPLLLQLLLFRSLPLLLGTTTKKISLALDCKVADVLFLIALVAFVINYACYFSVIFKGALNGIPKGQYEAGKVLGLKKSQIFSNIVFFQLIKRTLSPISNETITLVKDTALASSCSVLEMYARANDIVQNYVSFVPFIGAALFYLAFNGLLTLLFGFIEKKMSFYKE